jgi:hypothetical protein
MAPEAHGAQVLQDANYEHKNMRSAQTKTGLPCNFCFLKFLPSCTVEAEDAPQTLFRAPLTPGLGSWLGLGGLYLTKFTTGKVHYNFGFINFAQK